MQRTDGLVSRLPLHPLLFAAYPIVRLYGENMVEVELGEVVMPLLVVVGATALGLVALSILLRDSRRAAIVTSAVVLPVMLFGLVLEVAQPLLGDERIFLLLIVIAVIAAAVLVALRAGPRLGSITLALNVISLVLVLVAVIPATQGVAAVLQKDGDRTSRRSVSSADDPAPSRDIYHIVVDRYGSEQALQAGFGIDNAEFVTWLRDNGFDVIDDARANYAKTTLSLASTLGMSLLDDIAAAQGPDSENLAPVVRRIKRSRAGAFLQDLGYEYIHIGSWFRQTRDSGIADRTFVPVAEVSLASTLYDLSVLPVLANQDKPADTFARKHADTAEFQFDLLDDLADDPGPKYVFAHILLPHPPYVFLEDGTYAPDDATFETQLVDTNRRLRAFFEPLLSLPEEERPIIILQADEGPFPERLAADERAFEWADATDEELVTKFGILSAMYLPGPEGVAALPSGMTAVNTYPELFRRYFASDIENLPDRILASSKVKPYDLLDVTERVEAAME
ncbi:MAG: hypothetical protein ACC726_03460 [Chloroflexota bacterium]